MNPLPTSSFQAHPSPFTMLVTQSNQGAFSVPFPGRMAVPHAARLRQEALASTTTNPVSAQNAQTLTQTPTQAPARHPKMKKAWDMFILAGPIFGLISGLTLLAATPLSAKYAKRSGLEWLAHAVGKQAPSQKSLHRLASLGQRTMSYSWVMRSLNGIVAALSAGQPAMMLGNVLQLFPSLWLSLRESSTARQIVQVIGLGLGGLFTVGFANELKNKDPNTPTHEIRKYDMSRLKSVFDPQADLSFLNRIHMLGREAVKMTAFTIHDHALLLKNLAHSAQKLFQKPSSSDTGETISTSERIRHWASTPTAGKSQLFVVMSYLAAIPELLLKRSHPNLNKNKAIIALKGIGLLCANLVTLNIALKRDDLRGKTPLAATPLAVLGTAFGNPAIGNLGESMMDVFFSDMAVNGLNTGAKPKESV